MPIAAPGEMYQHSAIRITVGTNPPAEDNDPRVGITDGTTRNLFGIINDGSSSSYNSLCYVVGGQNNGMPGASSDPVSGEFTIILDPKDSFGTCTTNSGYEISASFNDQIDINKALDLVVTRDHAYEQYIFHYFLVEFL